LQVQVVVLEIAKHGQYGIICYLGVDS